MIRGERITLKPFTRETYRERYNWQTDPEVSYYAHGQNHAVTAPIDAFMAGYERYLAESPNDCGLFAVYSDTDELIGEVDYRGMDLVSRSVGIGVTLGKKEVWGKGYGADAVRTLCQFLFERFALERIQLDTWAETPERFGVTKRSVSKSRGSCVRPHWLTVYHPMWSSWACCGTN